MIRDIDHDFIKKSDGEQAFPIYKVALDIGQEQLIVKEYPYCCDEIPNPHGYEILRYDLNTMELLERIAITKPQI